MTSLSILGIERILQLERCYNCFQQPRASLCHKEAVEKIVTLPATTRDVGELLSGKHAPEKIENRQCFFEDSLQPEVCSSSRLCHLRTWRWNWWELLSAVETARWRSQSQSQNKASNELWCDTAQKCKTMKSALETTYEITKLEKYSPIRGQLFDEIKDDIAPGTPGVRGLCPTRWTVRADSMLSIIQNYTVLNELWDKACNVVGDTETIARIRGAAAQMASFEFFFGLLLGEMLLRHTDNLSRLLQHDHVSA